MSELTANQEALEEQRLANDLFGNVGNVSDSDLKETRTEAQIEEEASLASGTVLFVDYRSTAPAEEAPATKKRPVPVWEDEDDAPHGPLGEQASQEHDWQG